MKTWYHTSKQWVPGTAPTPKLHCNLKKISVAATHHCLLQQLAFGGTTFPHQQDRSCLAWQSVTEEALLTF